MARKRRVHVPGGIYHVTLRGNHRKDIFEIPEDRALMESLVAYSTTELGARTHAYCWMTNHIHLLVEVGHAPLGPIMQRIASTYARQIHKRARTTGHLFERRHFARLIDCERDLLTVIRYTHFNPVRAGLSPSPDLYPWSSHHAYTGKRQYPWLTTELALSMLGSSESDARTAYGSFMAEGQGVTLPCPFATPQDPDDLATSDAKPVRRPAAPSRRSRSEKFEELMQETCGEYGVALDAVTSARRSQDLCDVRVEIARRAVERGVASLTEVAQALGRSVAALSQAIRRRK